MEKESDPSATPGPGAPAPDSRSRVLVIDDDGTIRATLHTALEKDYIIFSVPNGEGVTVRIESFRPDILILDINLPGSDGYEICGEIRETAGAKELPILFMTVRKDNVSFVKTLETGGDSCIIKPFEISALRAKIEYLLKHHRESGYSNPGAGGES